MNCQNLNEKNSIKICQLTEDVLSNPKIIVDVTIPGNVKAPKLNKTCLL